MMPRKATLKSSQRDIESRKRCGRGTQMRRTRPVPRVSSRRLLERHGLTCTEAEFNLRADGKKLNYKRFRGTRTSS